MRFTFLFVCYLVFNLTAGFQEDDGDDDDIVSSHIPKFVSVPLTLTVSPGENITLPCELDKPGKQVIIWEKGKQTLFTNFYAIYRDKRISLTKEDFALHITNITDTDAGEYICRVGSEPPVMLTHTVGILVPPQVTTQPKNGLLSIKEGESFSIACENLGNPTPTISWKLEGKPLNIAEDTIRVAKATKEDEGLYECQAENGVGDPSKATVKVRVLSMPTIEMDKHWISTEEGATIELNCRVIGDPLPMAVWHHSNGSKLFETNRVHLRSMKEDHSLTIERITAEDFGVYVCLAHNVVGNISEVVHVSGLASPITLNFNQVSHIISWEVDSQSKLEQYSLKFRKILPDGTTDEWNQVIIPANDEKTYKLEGLEQDAKYEAVMTATNKFGTNEPSQVLKFSTVLMSNASLNLKSYFSLLLLPLLICLLPHLRSSCQR